MEFCFLQRTKHVLLDYQTTYLVDDIKSLGVMVCTYFCIYHVKMIQIREFWFVYIVTPYLECGALGNEAIPLNCRSYHDLMMPAQMQNSTTRQQNAFHLTLETSPSRGFSITAQSWKTFVSSFQITMPVLTFTAGWTLRTFDAYPSIVKFFAAPRQMTSRILT